MTEPFNLTPLGEGPEFDKIRRIWQRLGSRAQGGGDDCAFFPAPTGLIAVSTDLTIENVHFRVGWLTPHEIGYRAAAASLSDLAAVAAEPVGVLVSLGVSPEWPDEMIAELMNGVGEAVHGAGTALLGGDLVRSDRLVIDVVVTGSVTEPVLRSGARVGDALWVSGRLGGPAVALAAWERNQEPEQTARARFAAPKPRLREARWLKERGARAMIDVSDGLLADAGHLAAASGVRCVIETESVPRHASVTDKTTALVSGEEYELLCALPPQADAVGPDFADVFGVPLTRIGEVREGSGVELLRMAVPIEVPAGFRHF